MSDYEIGYGKPPRGSRFKPGVSGNPKGRPKRPAAPIGELLQEVFDQPIEYREGGKKKVATPFELGVKVLIDRAVAGDVRAAASILNLRVQAERQGDEAVAQILVEGWLPDYPRQTAEQKTAEVAGGRDVKPAPWWRRRKAD